MRVAIVTNLYVPHANGGAEKYCASLARSLRERGHDVAVVTNMPHSIFTDPAVINLDVKPDMRRLPLLMPDPRIDRKLRLILDAYAPDVVHVHNVHRTLGFGAYRVAGAWPCVATMHDYHLFCLITNNSRSEGTTCNDRRFCGSCARTFYPQKAREDGSGATAAISRSLQFVPGAYTLVARLRNLRRNRMLLSAVDLVIAPSLAVRETMLRWPLPPERVVHVANAVPLTAQTESPCPERPYTVGYIGKLVRSKGVQVLLDAAEIVRAQGVALRLLVAGDGADRNAFELQARQGRCEVTFLGSLGEREVDEFYRSVDVVTVPSVWPEPMPLVVLEALARGKAVVGARIGGIEEELSEGAGVLVQSNSAADLAAALVRLASRESRAVLERQGTARYRTYYQYSDHVDEIERIYTRVIVDVSSVSPDRSTV